jgi:thymidylate synthase (FAD)
MKVKLISHTPDPEKIIASAANLCYSPASIDAVMEHMTDEKTFSFIEMLMGLGHESPIEHVSFTFGIEGISRACSHQLVRHRIASYSQKSQRYVKESAFEYVTPPDIQAYKDMDILYSKAMNQIQKTYDELRAQLREIHITNGMKPLDAEKKANEDARYVLPNACETSIVVTMNARSLFNFFRLRCCNRAQWEIRSVADEMYKLCSKVAPHLFSFAGPACYTDGKCSEGKMCCGKPRKEEFSSFGK